MVNHVSMQVRDDMFLKESIKPSGRQQRRPGLWGGVGDRAGEGETVRLRKLFALLDLRPGNQVIVLTICTNSTCQNRSMFLFSVLRQLGAKGSYILQLGAIALWCLFTTVNASAEA